MNGLIRQWGAYSFTDDANKEYIRLPVCMSDLSFTVTGAFSERTTWHLVPTAIYTIRFRSSISTSTDVTIRYIVTGY